MSTDPYENQPKKKDTTTILLVVFGVLLLGCVGLSLVIVVCITAIATIGSNANGTFSLVATKVSSAGSSSPPVSIGNPEAEKVARQFLEDIGAGRIDLAHQRMTAQGKAVPQGSLQAEVDKNPALKQHQFFSLQAEQAVFNTVTYTANVVGREGGNVRVRLKLVNEDGRWLVDQFIIM